MRNAAVTCPGSPAAAGPVVPIDRRPAVGPLERWGRREIDLPETDRTGL